MIPRWLRLSTPYRPAGRRSSRGIPAVLAVAAIAAAACGGPDDATSGAESSAADPDGTSDGRTAASDIGPWLDDHFQKLADLHQALEAGSPEAAEEAAESLERTMAFLHTWERSRRSLARGIRVRSGDRDVNETVERFLDAAHTAQQRRMELPWNELAHLEGDMPPERFAERLEEFIEAHEAAREAGRELDRIKGDFDLPASATLYGPDEVELADGDDLAVDFVVENTAPDDFRDVSFSLETLPEGEEIPVTFTPEAIDRFPAGAARSLTIRGGVPDEAGTLITQLNVEGANVRESLTLTIRSGR